MRHCSFERPPQRLVWLDFQHRQLFCGGVVPAFAGADEDTVAKSVEHFRAAQAAANAEALCAAELSHSHSDGHVEDKATFIANATDGKTKWLSLEYRDPKIRVVGPAGILRFNWVAKARQWPTERRARPISTS
jgi:hypothetical protein